MPSPSLTPLGLSKDQVIDHRYRVLRRLASGGMGTVYEVEHLATERRLAMKVMASCVVSNESLRERFRREAKITAQIDSPHLVTVFDAGVDDETRLPFLVMELLRGQDLADRLEKKGRLPSQEVLSYLYQASLALDKTHKARIVHRDLKPENLFRVEAEDGSYQIKILDFGIAKVLREASGQGGNTAVLGTPLYMAPEQFGLGTVSPETDTYALAQIAFTLLVGQPYWQPEAQSSDSIFAFADAVRKGIQEPASVRAARLGIDLPGSFDNWFAKAVSVVPGGRYPLSSQAIEALAMALGQSYPPAVSLLPSEPPEPVRLLPKPRRIQRWALPALGAVFAVLTLGALHAAYGNRAEKKDPARDLPASATSSTRPLNPLDAGTLSPNSSTKEEAFVNWDASSRAAAASNSAGGHVPPPSRTHDRIKKQGSRGGLLQPKEDSPLYSRD